MEMAITEHVRLARLCTQTECLNWLIVYEQVGGWIGDGKEVNSPQLA